MLSPRIQSCHGVIDTSSARPVPEESGLPLTRRVHCKKRITGNLLHGETVPWLVLQDLD